MASVQTIALVPYQKQSPENWKTLPEKCHMIGAWRIREGYVGTDKTLRHRFLKSLFLPVHTKTQPPEFQTKLGPTTFPKISVVLDARKLWSNVNTRRNHGKGVFRIFVFRIFIFRIFVFKLKCISLDVFLKTWDVYGWVGPSKNVCVFLCVCMSMCM